MYSVLATLKNNPADAHVSQPLLPVNVFPVLFLTLGLLVSKQEDLGRLAAGTGPPPKKKKKGTCHPTDDG